VEKNRFLEGDLIANAGILPQVIPTKSIPALRAIFSLDGATGQVK
jgi:hypothetical protein